MIQCNELIRYSYVILQSTNQIHEVVLGEKTQPIQRSDGILILQWSLKLIGCSLCRIWPLKKREGIKSALYIELVLSFTCSVASSETSKEAAMQGASSGIGYGLKYQVKFTES